MGDSSNRRISSRSRSLGRRPRRAERLAGPPSRQRAVEEFAEEPRGGVLLADLGGPAIAAFALLPLHPSLLHRDLERGGDRGRGHRPLQVQGRDNLTQLGRPGVPEDFEDLQLARRSSALAGLAIGIRLLVPTAIVGVCIL